MLDDAKCRALLADSVDTPLAGVLDLLGEALKLLAPDPTTALRRAGIVDATRVSGTSHAAAAGAYPQISKALAGPATLLYASDAVHDEVRVMLSSPPVIVLGAEIAAIAAIRGANVDPKVEPMLRFMLGRVVELARPHRILAAGNDADSFALLVEGIWQAFGPPGEASTEPAVAAEAKRLRSSVPLTLRGRITDLIAKLPPRGTLGPRLGASALRADTPAIDRPRVPRSALDAGECLAACARAADRSGLLACGNATIAIEMAGGTQVASHLVRFAASRRYRHAIQELHTRKPGLQTRPR